ncbi:hypothetical protein KUV47_03905 [Vannielia litorea]|uniref:hypothetical protein n=1 Tax=Vannielia litorea TaxID=1217970 RepID=UPI001C96F7AF|nr:hypothetical protein [Vannielia litorea]MBY6152347.1 hypothetical protein [Vannielia litorea]
MFKTTVTAWLVRLAITWVGAGVIAFLVADYVLRENVEATGAAMGEVNAAVGRIEAGMAAQDGEIAALKSAVDGLAVAEAPADEAPAEEAPEEAAPEAGETAPEAAEGEPEEDADGEAPSE